MYNTDVVNTNQINPFLNMLVIASHLLQNEVQALSIAFKTLYDCPGSLFQISHFHSIAHILRLCR